MANTVNKTPPPVKQTGSELITTDLPSLTAALEARQEQFMALLGSEAAVARFRTVAIHAVGSRPELLACNPLTIIEAIREAATLDLEPTGVLGEAWLIPYKGLAKLRIGWQGHLKLIRRTGEVATVDCQVVYDKDEFMLSLGTDPSIYHVPALGDRGGYRGAYAWAKLKSGDLVIEWLPMADIEPIMKLAAADSLMWTKFPGEGMRKSAIRRLQKRLPKSALLEQALKVEAEAEEYVPVEAPPARNAAIAAISSRFGGQESGVEPQPATTLDGTIQPAHGIIEATPLDEALAGMTEPQDAGVDGDPSAPAPVPEAEVEKVKAEVKKATKEVAQADPSKQCESLSPWTEGTQCKLPQGHGRLHRTDKESWE